MNRIGPEASLIDPMLAGPESGWSRLSRLRGVGPGPYSLFGPLHYEANYAYPLIVWLHGPGDDEHQLRRMMPLISLRNYVAVAPRGTVVASAAEVIPAGVASGGPLAPIAGANRLLLAANRRAHSGGRGAVMECLDAARGKISYSAGPLFLAGYGCGGTMAFRVALRDRGVLPECFHLWAIPSGRSPWPNCTTPAGWRCFSPARRASSIPRAPCATICGCCTRRACRSYCGSIRATTLLRRC